jgi:isopentenyl diphosphate isomerase/L-lactate dehydrogenase-like FMN-dependent dehydrogenase
MMGAERELALVNNFEAVARPRLMTKFLVGLGERDACIELFRKRIAFPLAIAPTGVAGLCWFEGEIALAKAAAKAGVPFTLTSRALTSIDGSSRRLAAISGSSFSPGRKRPSPLSQKPATWVSTRLW